ncbi:potassium-transporting ATPase subunit F [Segniliparus rugosus]|uniref:K+-transporting ATPase, F subunit n=1 Tax=Segniliparus rugosus (strain ATCC BAA-974 / DSM 45345 / CCUG 50838 / CIP 108380 / JCM 13579 / CDC 945) TaxID=679197 RepID=U1N8I4_SEGRC|nr:potassium-transporting ATPase subunit F [Segniliparus rugosus]ERG69153.1 K+-transporting ATPase, F subunit [Segniliparus rugosus ATCC BAA-974]
MTLAGAVSVVLLVLAAVLAVYLFVTLVDPERF